MADGHGGHRTPAHPAPVSGPGALSRRTDGGPTQPPQVAPGGPYGSRQDMMSLQQSAPMQGGGGATPVAADLPSLDAPTANPGEPVTAGADAGPGIGAAAAGIVDPQTASLQEIAHLVPSLDFIANLPGATQETRDWVRALKVRMSGLPQ